MKKDVGSKGKYSKLAVIAFIVSTIPLISLILAYLFSVEFLFSVFLIFGFIYPLLAFSIIVASLISLFTISKFKNLKGRGFAITAIIFSILDVLIFVYYARAMANT